MGIMELPKEALRKWVEQVANTREDELDCEQVFRVLDACAEAAARGEEIAELMPMVKHHLDMCRGCREEYEALLRAIEIRL